MNVYLIVQMDIMHLIIYVYSVKHHVLLVKMEMIVLQLIQLMDMFKMVL